MARCELDVHRLGCVSRFPFPALDTDGQEPQIYQPSGGRADFADNKRDRPDASDVLLGDDRVDNLPCGEHRSGVGVFLRDVAVRHIAGKLSFWPGMWPTNLFIIIMLLVEWLQRDKEHGMDLTCIEKQWIRTLIYYGLVLILVVSSGQSSTFIYFQF